MPKRRVTITGYQCDGPRCDVTSNDLAFVRAQWIVIHMPFGERVSYLHRLECAIAYLNKISDVLDAVVIKAHIGEPVPAGAR